MAFTHNNYSYRHSGKRRTVFYAAFLLLFIMSTSVQAQEVVDVGGGLDPYTIENIEVDITADNAVQAREQAFEAAQIKGYEELAKRTLSAEALDKFETPDINTVSASVQDYEVSNEKLSAVRYSGTYKISYSKQTFSQLSQTEDGINQIVQNGDTLILPFIQHGSRSFLWQANPFMNAWVRARNNQMTGRAIVPVGDIDDITQVRDNQAQNYDPSRLNAMRLRYQAQAAKVLVAETRNYATDGSTEAIVKIYDAAPYGPQLMQTIPVRSYVGEGDEQFYNRVVSKIVGALGHAPDTQVIDNAINEMAPPVVGVGVQNKLTAQLHFMSVREWIDIKKTLERSVGITNVQVRSLTPRMAVVDVGYQGNINNLRDTLQRSGVALDDPRGSDYYQLRRPVSNNTY